MVSVLVKSLEVVYTGLSATTASTSPTLAFCTLFTFSYRLTLAVLPWTLVVMAWLKVGNI